MDEILEFLVAANDAGLAPVLDEHAGAPAVDVGGDDAGLRDPVMLLGGARRPFLLEPPDGLVILPAGGLEGLPAVHDAGAGLLPQAFDERRGDRRHRAHGFPGAVSFAGRAFKIRFFFDPSGSTFAASSVAPGSTTSSSPSTCSVETSGRRADSAAAAAAAAAARPSA